LAQSVVALAGGDGAVPVLRGLLELGDPGLALRFLLLGDAHRLLLGRLHHRVDGDHQPGVVDPGVGGPRRPVALRSHGDHLFVGPDNGVLAPIVERWPASALVELVNLHDDGLEFEAIHRAVFNVDPDSLLTALAAFCVAQGSTLTLLDCPSWPAAKQTWVEWQQQPRGQAIAFVSRDYCGVLHIGQPRLLLPVTTLQAFLDDYLPTLPAARLDYIHGEAALEQLGGIAGNIGFYLPALDKNDFFRTVIRDGALPRKTFSMGEAREKRFYMEARRII
jgi:hypothetical protein